MSIDQIFGLQFCFGNRLGEYYFFYILSEILFIIHKYMVKGSFDHLLHFYLLPPLLISLADLFAPITPCPSYTLPFHLSYSTTLLALHPLSPYLLPPPRLPFNLYFAALPYPFPFPLFISLPFPHP